MRIARLLEGAAAPVAGLSAAGFAALSAARRRRVFHPYGETFQGDVTFTESPFFPPGEHEALIRFSRGIGLPESVPDFLGLAIKLPGLEQDLLLVSSGEGTITRHLLLPASDYLQSRYSTVLPYAWEQQTIVFGARPSPDQTFSAARGLDLRRRASTGDIRFSLTWGSEGREMVPFGQLVADRVHVGDLSFNPFNSRPGLEPAGALNRLRLDAYRKSQQARPDARGVA